MSRFPGKKPPFLSSRSRSFDGVISGVEVSIPKKVPTESEGDVFILGQVAKGAFALGSNNQGICFGNDTQRSCTSRIDLSGKVGHDLVRIIVLRRDDGKNDAPLISYVRTCKGLYEFRILGRLLFVRRMEEARISPLWRASSLLHTSPLVPS